MIMERLFVYGSLAPSRPNHHILEGIEGSWQSASLRGRLLEEGWGADMGFPGIVLDPAGQEVEGFVFSSSRLSEHWPRLDDFEGEAYERVVATVRLDDQRQVEAFVYALRDKS